MSSNSKDDTIGEGKTASDLAICPVDPENEREEESFGHFNASDHMSSSDDISGSLGSHSYSTAVAGAKQGKIVELIQENNNRNTSEQPSNWIIRPEFYTEDVVMNQVIEDESSSNTDAGCRDGIVHSANTIGNRHRLRDDDDDDDDEGDEDDDDLDEADIELANRELNAIWINVRNEYYSDEQQLRRTLAHHALNLLRLQVDDGDGSDEAIAARARQLNNLDQIESMLRHNMFEHVEEDDPEVDDHDDDDITDDQLESDSEDESDIDDYEDLGFMAPNVEISSDDSEGSNQEDLVNYDIMLPVNHSYLGDNLEESQGRQVLEENSEIDLLLFNLETVLFPGQSLPITTLNLNPRIGTTLKQCINRGSKIIGIIYEPQVNSIGTIAEIRNFFIGNDELKLILEGSQRFKLLGSPFETAIRGRVRILPEVVLGPSHPRISNSFSRLGLFKPQIGQMSPNLPYSIISKLPPWIHQRYDARFLSIRLLAQIKNWCSISDLTCKHPNDFSYWMSSMLPINDLERVEALSLGCAEARLLWLVDLLEKCKHFVCTNCENKICRKEDVFAMSRSGPQCSFVNSGGYIHDTLTVKSTCGLFLEVGWVEEFSWFPGYKWRIAHCRNCSHHIGWCYKHIDIKTRPKRFFGLSRNNVRLKKLAGDSEL